MFISPLDKKILREYKKVACKLAKAEGNDIFEKYLSIQTKHHLNVLKTLSKQLHKVHKDKRIFILIPAFYENDNITHTLDTLIPRNNRLLHFWCSKVLIVILNNFYNKQPNTHASDIVEKYIESRRFRDIYVINYALPHTKSSVGYCRKILHDLIIYNANRLTQKLEDCIFVSSDADILENDLRIFKKAYTLLLNQDSIDAAQGAMTRIPKYVNRNNLFCIYSLLYDGMRDEWQSKKYRKNGVPQINFMWNRVFTYGANLFLKADVYCRVGGFDRFNVGEDYAIGAKISFLYSADGEEFKTANTNTIKRFGYTVVNHPRRDLHSFLHQFSSVYAKFGEYQAERKIRKAGRRWQDLFDEIGRKMPINDENIYMIFSLLYDKIRQRSFDHKESVRILDRAVRRTIRTERKKLHPKTVDILLKQMKKFYPPS